jgi:hypothetical protein
MSSFFVAGVPRRWKSLLQQGHTRWREERLELIEANLGALDAAMLDINLGDDTTSHDIAAALAAAGVPFIVTTGYDDAPQLVGLESRPRLEKPYDKDGVALALRLLYRTGNDADQL